MDINTVSTLLGSLKTASELAKLIKDSGVSLEQAEVKLRFAELISALADAKTEVAGIQQTLLDKDEEIRQLQEQLKVKAKVQYQSPYYYLIDGDKKDGPFCQHCYDKDKALIRLQYQGEGWWCLVCKNIYD